MNQRHIPPDPWRITSRSPWETRRLGYLLGRKAAAGTVLALGGELGAGKTTLVQGLARGLEVPKEYYITSPTFTLINEYPGRWVLYHVDLYRLGNPDEALEIGVGEILALGRGIVAIEWAGRLGPLLPEIHLSVEMTMEPAAQGADQRLITIRGHGKSARRLMQTLRKDWRRAD